MSCGRNQSKEYNVITLTEVLNGYRWILVTVKRRRQRRKFFSDYTINENESHKKLYLKTNTTKPLFSLDTRWTVKRVKELFTSNKPRCMTLFMVQRILLVAVAIQQCVSYKSLKRNWCWKTLSKSNEKWCGKFFIVWNGMLETDRWIMDLVNSLPIVKNEWRECLPPNMSYGNLILSDLNSISRERREEGTSIHMWVRKGYQKMSISMIRLFDTINLT